ncbi:MAG: phenylalanine--tRNA ligase subunit beta [Candidatus Tumulicola sp.]
MRVPIDWLREFVDLPEETAAIADRLAMLGFPVEDVEHRPAIAGVVVGRILNLEKHPNADRLTVGRVDAGGEHALTIVTAATNVAAGQTIAVATIGARLPQLTIEPRKMRGIASEGMMISAEELALPAEWFEDGIMQLNADRASLGTNAVELLGLGGDVLDVEITTNRVDAMSIIGLARELAASYGRPLRLPSLDNPGSASEAPGEAPQVTIDSPDCHRFVAQRFGGIRIGPAPAWMRVRLALAGQRPINNVVDVSNYVMIETGQPLHFYDAAAVRESKLIVRDGRDGESIVTLDGVKRTLSPQALVIAGPREPLGLAGLMGGKDSEVNAATTAIILEAANFNGARIRRTSQALGLRTEAASRHEKALAPALADAGAARAAHLLTSLGASPFRPHAFGAELVRANSIALRVAEVTRLLGLVLPAQTIADHLRALGCGVTADAEEILSVVPPPWRNDLSGAADLVEEIARMEGYDRIEAVVPPVPSHAISSARYDRETAIAHALATLGYREIITHSLHGRDLLDRQRRGGMELGGHPAEVLNPLSEEQRFLRSSMIPGLASYFAGVAAPMRIFEIGHVFMRNDDRFVERAMLAFGFSAEPVDEPPWHDAHFLRLKGDCEALLSMVTGRRTDAGPSVAPGLHPGKTAALTLGGETVAHLGQLDPRVGRAFDVRLPVYLCSVEIEGLPGYALPHYRPPSKFPGTSRDLALSVDLRVSARDVEQTIVRALGVTCTGVRVFDEYRGEQAGEGRKSLAVRMALQRFDATITDEEADEAVARALGALEDALGAVIRT